MAPPALRRSPSGALILDLSVAKAQAMPSDSKAWNWDSVLLVGHCAQKLILHAIMSVKTSVRSKEFEVRGRDIRNRPLSPGRL